MICLSHKMTIKGKILIIWVEGGSRVVILAIMTWEMLTQKMHQ